MKPTYVETYIKGSEKERWMLDHDVHLWDVHPGSQCAGRPCVLHNPTDHHMSGWRLHYRDDRNIFERICPHGIGHPDPDQEEYWESIGQSAQGIHGCDGCCAVDQSRLVDWSDSD